LPSGRTEDFQSTQEDPTSVMITSQGRVELVRPSYIERGILQIAGIRSGEMSVEKVGDLGWAYHGALTSRSMDYLPGVIRDADTNGDGKISRAEIDALRASTCEKAYQENHNTPTEPKINTVRV
jgi:hypothetical protein